MTHAAFLLSILLLAAGLLFVVSSEGKADARLVLHLSAGCILSIAAVFVAYMS
jgi:hypothetical protein